VGSLGREGKGVQRSNEVRESKDLAERAVSVCSDSVLLDALEVRPMAKQPKYEFICNFCEKKFKRTIPKNAEIRCPKCKEYDVELIGKAR
jgi:hypothetical protein